MAITVIVHGDRPSPDPAGRSITFDTPRVVIGRGANCDVRLPDPSVSLRHLTIRQKGRSFVVVDESSTNGTLLGRTRLSPGAPEAMGEHALLRIGRYVLELRVENSTATPQPAAVAKQIAVGLVIEQLLEEGEDGRPRVFVEAGPDEGADLFLAPGERATIGRSKEATLALTDADASRRHVEVVWRGDAIYARDLGSKSGSALGDRVLGSADAIWRAGEVLRVGETEIACSFTAPDALGEIERAPDERVPVAAIDMAAFMPEPEPEPEEEAEGVSEALADDGTAEDVAAEEAEPEIEEPRRRGATWGVTDIAVLLLALGVFSLSAVGYVVLL
ncbi:MAG: FHA domain-containing protein, partial [Polyangiaceae bacterium]|nr:FHA domain-containing protein [Polyangiaceae bacterium]